MPEEKTENIFSYQRLQNREISECWKRNALKRTENVSAVEITAPEDYHPSFFMFSEGKSNGLQKKINSKKQGISVKF